MWVYFQWDKLKAATNLKKHKISFEEATTVFEDGWSYSFPDAVHSISEERYLIIGISRFQKILVISYTHIETQEQEIIRIISARKATKNESRFYEEKKNGKR